jgi:membrane-associated phospholipid phosphatase
LKKEGVKKHDDFIKIPYVMSDSEHRSFPSGHVAFLLFFGFIFSFYFNNLIILFIFLGLDVVMAICRLIVGVHYPIDVIFGFIFAIFYSFLYLAWTSPFWVEFYYWIGPIISNIVYLRF